MFPWKDFLMGHIRKIQKHKEERDKSGKLKRKRKEKGKKKERFFHLWRFPYSSVLLKEGHTLTRAVTSPTTY